MGAVKGNMTMSFAYNSDGLRVAKTVNGVTTYYVYDGTLLIAEYTDTKAIIYIYDANGSPIGFKCRKSSYADDTWDVYFYEKNLQGDIVAVYSSSGVKLVGYDYNAWGITTKSYSNGGASTTVVNNNLTYRGYYYDADLSMYYLQSRYYDPVVCRFISPDALGYLGANGDLTSYNLYAYCSNNPVNYVDNTGEFPIAASIGTFLLTSTAIFIVAVTSMCVKYTSSNSNETNSIDDLFTIAITDNDSNNVRNYTVYALKNPNTGEIKYVGRTKNPVARESAHRSSLFRGHLVFCILEDGLSKYEARGLEQYYMILYHTVNTSNPMNNQINGIASSNPNRFAYFNATLKYLDNRISNEFLNWAGI